MLQAESARSHLVRALWMLCGDYFRCSQLLGHPCDKEISMPDCFWQSEDLLLAASMRLSRGQRKRAERINFSARILTSELSGSAAGNGLS
jgi:hypothetical protein